MLDLMTRHPRSVGETYGGHLLAAWSFAGALALAALACFLHGLLPFLCQSTASRQVGRLHSRLTRRGGAVAPTGIAADARA